MPDADTLTVPATREDVDNFLGDGADNADAFYEAVKANEAWRSSRSAPEQFDLRDVPVAVSSDVDVKEVAPTAEVIEEGGNNRDDDEGYRGRFGRGV